MANNKKLYVGNISHSLDNHDLENAFKPFGVVESAVVIMDRDNPGRSKGFGFVEMATTAQAQAAIDALNGTELEGRTITVNEARPQEPRTDRGGPSRSGPSRSGGSRTGDSRGGDSRGGESRGGYGGGAGRRY
jgi:cold-inducible RNA-binding protein